MSSWKKAGKAGQKTHRERHQPENRAHLGLLEKKKDYKLRARDYNKKKRTLELLKRRALDKNPDEFYFHMVNSETVDGVHHELEKDDEHTPEQLMLMNTQDLRYVTMKRTIEKKKKESLQAQLHMLDTANKTKNKHIFFVDSADEAKNFDVAKRLNTHPSFLKQKINRMKLSDLENVKLNLNKSEIRKMAKERKKLYEHLAKRVEREKELSVVQQKLQNKRNLMTSGHLKLQKIKKATKNSAAIYKWEYERKK